MSSSRGPEGAGENKKETMSFVLDDQASVRAEGGQYTYVRKIPLIRHVVFNGNEQESLACVDEVTALEQYRYPSKKSARDEVTQVAGSGFGAIAAAFFAAGATAQKFKEINRREIETREFLKEELAASIQNVLIEKLKIFDVIEPRVDKKYRFNIKLYHQLCDDAKLTREEIILLDNLIGGIQIYDKIIPNFPLTFGLFRVLHKLDPDSFKELSMTVLDKEQGVRLINADNAADTEIADACLASVKQFSSQNKESSALIDRELVKKATVSVFARLRKRGVTEGEQGQNLETLVLDLDNPREEQRLSRYLAGRVDTESKQEKSFHHRCDDLVSLLLYLPKDLLVSLEENHPLFLGKPENFKNTVFEIRNEIDSFIQGRYPSQNNLESALIELEKKFTQTASDLVIPSLKPFHDYLNYELHRNNPHLKTRKSALEKEQVRRKERLTNLLVYLDGFVTKKEAMTQSGGLFTRRSLTSWIKSRNTEEALAQRAQAVAIARSIADRIRGALSDPAQAFYDNTNNYYEFIADVDAIVKGHPALKSSFVREILPKFITEEQRLSIAFLPKKESDELKFKISWKAFIGNVRNGNTSIPIEKSKGYFLLAGEDYAYEEFLKLYPDADFGNSSIEQLFWPVAFKLDELINPSSLTPRSAQADEEELSSGKIIGGRKIAIGVYSEDIEKGTQFYRQLQALIAKLHPKEYDRPKIYLMLGKESEGFDAIARTYTRFDFILTPTDESREGDNLKRETFVNSIGTTAVVTQTNPQDFEFLSGCDIRSLSNHKIPTKTFIPEESKESKTTPFVISVMGGMGPEADGYTLNCLKNKIKKQKLEDQISVYLLSDPRIPRSAEDAANLRKNFSYLKRVSYFLAHEKSNLIIAPSNTFHTGPQYPVFQRLSGYKISSIIEAVKKEINTRYKNRKIGILATTTTANSGIYATADIGATMITPSKEIQDRYVMAGINQMKTGNLDAARKLFNLAIEELRKQGAEVILLGCTEIPLAFEGNPPTMPYIDSADVLASVAIENILRLRDDPLILCVSEVIAVRASTPEIEILKKYLHDAATDTNYDVFRKKLESVLFNANFSEPELAKALAEKLKEAILPEGKSLYQRCEESYQQSEKDQDRGVSYLI